MPRTYCQECGSEVPVDADGLCHVGHLVDVDGGTTAPADELRAGPGRDPGDDPDEPLPWVAEVETDEDAAAGAGPDGPVDDRGDVPVDDGTDAPVPPPPSAPSTPPPAASVAPDEPAWEPADDPMTWSAPAEHTADDVEEVADDGGARGSGSPASSEALAAAAAAAAADTDTDEIDLDDLDAVVGLGFDDDEPRPPAAPSSPPDGPVVGDGAGEPSGGDHAGGPTDGARTGEPAAPPHDDGPDRGGVTAGADAAGTSPEPPASDADGVDLSNFTAKGARVDDERDGRKGRFRFRR